VDAADRNTCELFEIGDDGAECMAIIWVAVQRLGVQAGAKAPLEWSSTAQAVLDRAPDRLAVLKQYVRRFRPRIFSGSLAAAMEAPLPSLRALEAHRTRRLRNLPKRRESDYGSKLRRFGAGRPKRTSRRTNGSSSA
jgi:hypothetical protein